MDEFELVGLLVFVIMFAGTIVWHNTRDEKWREKLQRIATKVNGDVKSEQVFLWKRTFLEMPVAGCQGVLERRPGSRSEKKHTKLKVELPKENQLEILIYPESIATKIGKAVGLEDIEVGDKKFDRQFRIKGDPRHLVLDLLDEKVRASIERLYQLHKKTFRILLLRNYHSLEIRKDCWFDDEQHLLEFIGLTENIVEKLLEIQGLAGKKQSRRT
ncbi:MAG: hypothetical protein D6806_02435 [Deltaproteobacteria bacterium]|nr:MAG: hypothetical protein D6806_02435 [Deltaproteobacteria bacterium]